MAIPAMATLRTNARAGIRRRTSRAANGGDSDIGALDLVAADVGLRPHLRSQINMLPLSRRDHALACAVVESLDDDGYLRTALEELARLSDLEPRSRRRRCRSR
jgi:RNA polymerase sigma-54 factor